MDIDDINQISKRLQSWVSDLECTNKILHNELDDLEQYSRWNCLVFYGKNKDQK